MKTPLPRFLPLLGLALGACASTPVTAIPDPGRLSAPERSGSQPASPGISQHTLALPDGTLVRYTLSVPEGYLPGEPVPLVLALHFGGKITPFYGRNILELLVEPGLRELGAIIVAPDALDPGWNDPRDEAAVLALLDHVSETYAIDPKRVLCTGYSMGGAGTWFIANRHQDRFTAALPIAGRPPQEGQSWTIPLYVIHSRDDEVVPLGPTEAHVASLRNQGADVRLVIVEGLRHFDTPRFVGPLQEAVPWLVEIWAQRP